jgi:hypothetical protein
MMVLSSTGRPEVIGRWINSGRKGLPVIVDLPAFVASWKKWWTSLQPKSRVQKGGKWSHEVDDGEEWEDLRKGSINGFFNVVVSLASWCVALKTGAQQKLFGEVVKDVSWVMDQMIVVGGAKRKHSEVESGGEYLVKVKRYVSYNLCL